MRRSITPCWVRIRTWRSGILTQAADMLRGPLGRALGIRHSPELRFVQDELIESGARLSALINKAVKNDVATSRR